jgi:hypothetical protein
MNRLYPKIVLTLWAFFLCGCTEPQQEPLQDPLAGIKITDLASKNPEQIPPQTTFNVFLFEMPAENSYLIEQIFGGLYQRPIHFADYGMFEANALLAGFGRPGMWERIAQKLVQGKAEKVMMSALIIFDEIGEDIAAVPINSEQTIFYTDAENSVIGRSLSDGVLVWNIRSRPISSVRGVAQVQIEPVSRRSIDMVLARMGKKVSEDKNEFAFAGFELQMSMGDFVLLGPSEYQSDRITLSSLFFTVQRDKPVIRLYLIVCAGVGN